jgi:adenylate kinase
VVRQVYESLQSIKSKFHFHFINGEGSKLEVQDRIIKELTYQSAMELSNETFEKVRQIPLASEIIANARHELVKRLDHYKARTPRTFARGLSVRNVEIVA